MISKIDFLNGKFLKQFKDSKNFASFMDKLSPEKGKAGMYQHLGYGKRALKAAKG